MTLNLNTLALWAGLASASAAVYFPVRAELNASQRADAAEHQAQMERAAQAQKDWGLLLHRLGNDEAAIAFLETQMPKDKREMLRAIAQAQLNETAIEQQAPLRFTKGMHKKTEVKK